MKNILDVIPPPVDGPKEVPERSDWDGLAFDASLQGLLKLYGSGSFCDFLWLYNPATLNGNLNLRLQHRRQHSAFREIIEPIVVEPFYQACAVTDNGDVFFHGLLKNEGRAGSIYLVEGRGPKCEKWDGDIVDFLLAVHGGTLVSAVLPDDWMDEGLRFFGVG